MNKYNLQQIRGAWGAGRAAQTKADGIAGKWFHSFKKGHSEWQVRRTLCEIARRPFYRRAT